MRSWQHALKSSNKDSQHWGHSLITDEDSPATHVALHILRCSLLAKHTHLLRYLPRSVCHAWAVDMDDQVLAFLQRTVHFGELTEHQRDILSLPVREAEFGMYRLAHERVFHHAGAILALAGVQALVQFPFGGVGTYSAICYGGCCRGPRPASLHRAW
eukprot:1393813-Amphidinium_carterae.1